LCARIFRLTWGGVLWYGGEGGELDFFIDTDGNGVEGSGGLAGIQHFNVLPNAVWSGTKYFANDLDLAL